MFSDFFWNIARKKEVSFSNLTISSPTHPPPVSHSLLRGKLCLPGDGVHGDLYLGWEKSLLGTYNSTGGRVFLRSDIPLGLPYSVVVFPLIESKLAKYLEVSWNFMEFMHSRKFAKIYHKGKTAHSWVLTGAKACQSCRPQKNTVNWLSRNEI